VDAVIGTNTDLKSEAEIVGSDDLLPVNVMAIDIPPLRNGWMIFHCLPVIFDKYSRCCAKITAFTRRH
jgi:hypothetical protein